MTEFINMTVDVFTYIAPYALVWAMARKVFVYTVNAVTGNHAEF